MGLLKPSPMAARPPFLFFPYFFLARVLVAPFSASTSRPARCSARRSGPQTEQVRTDWFRRPQRKQLGCAGFSHSQRR